MVDFNLELCVTEPCLPRLSLTECSITAAGKEADTLVSTPSLHLLPPFLPFSSPPWGRFFLWNTIYPLLSAPAKSLESSLGHSLVHNVVSLSRCYAVWLACGTYFGHHLTQRYSVEPWFVGNIVYINDLHPVLQCVGYVTCGETLCFTTSYCLIHTMYMKMRTLYSSQGLRVSARRWVWMDPWLQSFVFIELGHDRDFLTKVLQLPCTF